MHRKLILLPVFLLMAAAAELPIQRVDIHVDGARPLAGERSRFAISPSGEIAFTYTLAAHDLSCKPLGLIQPDGEIRLTAVDSESTWNVEGWGTHGFPFDLAYDSTGELHVATRHRGQPYGVDYWRRVDGDWKLESFGAGVTFGGNNVALGLKSGDRPVVISLDRNRSRLAVWERDDGGEWSASLPAMLGNAAAGHFDLVVEGDGRLRVIFCQNGGPAVCATRDLGGDWTKAPISDAAPARMIAATRDASGRTHVSFASGKAVHYAVLGENDTWTSKIVAEAAAGNHAGRTDVSAAGGRVAIAWERGLGPNFAPKDYGGVTGAAMLTTIESDGAVATRELVPNNGGRPSVALSSDGTTAWVGVYTGNTAGDDFYLLRIGPGEAPQVSGDAVSQFRDGCLRDIDSGNAKAELRGLQRIDFSTLTTAQRHDLIGRFLDHDDPRIRKSMAAALGGSVEAQEQFASRMPEILRDPDGLVRKTFLESLAGAENAKFAAPVLETALVGDDPTNRLCAAEVVRQHPDWLAPAVLDRAVEAMIRNLGSGSAEMALEQLVDVGNVREKLGNAAKTGAPLQRVRAALIRFRCGEEIDLGALAEVPGKAGRQTQLALCGLLGQMRRAESVSLLEKLLGSEFPAVRSAAVFALRSVGHNAELKPVAKHPKGFDLLALRANAPESAAAAALTKALGHNDPNVRQKSCDALNRIGAKSARAAIRPLLRDDDAGVRIAAKIAIAALDDQPGEGLIDLETWQNATPNRKTRQINAIHRLPTEVSNGVVQAGGDKQLLIDDFVIARQTGLTRRLHPFEKHPRNPVLQAQAPWEEGWADPFMSTVLYDAAERCFKMWYRCGPRHSLKAYAVSADGIHWERPNIAQNAWQEFSRHNLLGFEGKIATWKKPGNNVLFFPSAEGDARYLSLFYQPPTKDYAISRSADGITWTQPKSVRQAHGDVVGLVSDPAGGDFLFFPKYMRQHEGHTRRSFTAARLASLDAPFSASFPFLAAHRDDARVVEDAARAYGSLLPGTLRLGEFHSEIYSVTAIPYQGVVVALYDLWPVIGSREGPLDMPLKVSRDLKTWTDVDYPRRALSIGEFGEWDSGMVYGGNTLLVVDDRIWLYYLGANMGHCTRILPATKPYHSVGVGLATLRLDGFASLQAAGEPGEFTTKPMNVAGGRLQINARCREGGAIRVALLGPEGNALPGFALEDCVPFTGDDLRHVVRWKSGAEIAAGVVSMRVEVVEAEVFAFQFAP